MADTIPAEVRELAERIADYMGKLHGHKARPEIVSDTATLIAASWPKPPEDVRGLVERLRNMVHRVDRAGKETATEAAAALSLTAKPTATADWQAKWRSDVGILLATLDEFAEAVGDGETPDDEGGLLAAIRSEHSEESSPKAKPTAEARKVADAIDPRKNAFSFFVGDPAVMEPLRYQVDSTALIAAADLIRALKEK